MSNSDIMVRICVIALKAALTRACKEGGKFRSPGRRAIEAVDLQVLGTNAKRAGRKGGRRRGCAWPDQSGSSPQERISFVSAFFSESVRIDKGVKGIIE